MGIRVPRGFNPEGGPPKYASRGHAIAAKHAEMKRAGFTGALPAISPGAFRKHWKSSLTGRAPRDLQKDYWNYVQRNRANQGLFSRWQRGESVQELEENMANDPRLQNQDQLDFNNNRSVPNNTNVDTELA